MQQTTNQPPADRWHRTLSRAFRRAVRAKDLDRAIRWRAALWFARHNDRATAIRGYASWRRCLAIARRFGLDPWLPGLGDETRRRATLAMRQMRKDDPNG